MKIDRQPKLEHLKTIILSGKCHFHYRTIRRLPEGDSFVLECTDEPISPTALQAGISCWFDALLPSRHYAHVTKKLDTGRNPGAMYTPSASWLKKSTEPSSVPEPRTKRLPQRGSCKYLGTGTEL